MDNQIKEGSNKNVYCAISLLFLCASLFTMLTCDKCKPFDEYISSLSDEQKKIYYGIRKERLTIYVLGLIVGILCSIAFMTYFGKSDNIAYHSCIITAISLFVQYIFYMLFPKSKYMLDYLTNETQVKNWLKVYKTMSFRYIFGMVIGLIGYIMLTYNLI